MYAYHEYGTVPISSGSQSTRQCCGHEIDVNDTFWSTPVTGDKITTSIARVRLTAQVATDSRLHWKHHNIPLGYFRR